MIDLCAFLLGAPVRQLTVDQQVDLIPRRRTSPRVPPTFIPAVYFDARGFSRVNDPELFAAYGETDQDVMTPRELSSITQVYENARRNGTVHLLGEWICGSCHEQSDTLRTLG